MASRTLPLRGGPGTALRRPIPEHLHFDGIAFAAKHQMLPLTSNDTRAATRVSDTPAQPGPRLAAEPSIEAVSSSTHRPLTQDRNLHFRTKKIVDRPARPKYRCLQPISAIDLSNRSQRRDHCNGPTKRRRIRFSGVCLIHPFEGATAGKTGLLRRCSCTEYSDSPSPANVKIWRVQ